MMQPKSLDTVLKLASEAVERKETVSIPLLRINATIGEGEKVRSLVLSGKVVARQPDLLRMKISKANHHLASMVVNGHKASIYFPRTNKVFETEINKSTVEEEGGIDIVARAFEMSLIFLKGPFPEYPLRRYRVIGTRKGMYVYRAEIPGGTLTLYVDSRSCHVLKRVYVLQGKKHEWAVKIEFSKYEITPPRSVFPRKAVLTVSRKGDDEVFFRAEMFCSRISFNKKVADKAFISEWPEHAEVITNLPSDPEELFGSLKDEREDVGNGE